MNRIIYLGTSYFPVCTKISLKLCIYGLPVNIFATSESAAGLSFIQVPTRETAPVPF
jgi:hypothetical protein